MRDIRRFENSQLFGIKARDTSVRSGVKVAVVGGFKPTGSVRPGFRVNFTSTEGVAGTAQVIRFSERTAAERWIDQHGASYGYDQDDLSVMNNLSQTFIRIPLADFETDAWVNKVWVDRISSRTIAYMNTYCPEYIDDNIEQLPAENTSNYRGFRF